jgi:hypothetical protein
VPAAKPPPSADIYVLYPMVRSTATLMKAGPVTVMKLVKLMESVVTEMSIGLVMFARRAILAPFERAREVKTKVPVDAPTV